MAKIKAKITLKTINEITSIIQNEVIATLEDHRIVYEEGDIVVELTFDHDQASMKRMNRDYEICMNYQPEKETTGSYDIHDINQHLELVIKTNRFEQSDQQILIHYQLVMDEEDLGIFEFQLDYEVVE